MIDQIPEYKFCLVGDVDDSFLPIKSKKSDTGWDVRSSADVTFDLPTDKALIPLGIKAFIPEGWCLKLKPRSSTFAKLDLHCLYGEIDEGYENQIMLAVKWIPPFVQDRNLGFKCNKFEFASNVKTLTISKGDRIGQLIPVRRQEMKVTKVSEDEFKKLCDKRGGERGLGGFGASGSK